MKKALLIIGFIVIFFAGCKKDDILEASKVEMKDVTMERGWEHVKMSGEYSYPQALEGMKIIVSSNENMSGSVEYVCALEGKKFDVTIDNLEAGVTYYYRYEYDNGYDKARGDKANFVTVGKPIVVTNNVVNITKNSAVLSGSVTNNDVENKINVRGFCWSKNTNPTISGSHNNNGSSSGTGTSSFTYNLSYLESNTKYYVRAYARTDWGVVYGEVKSFVTMREEPEVPEEPEETISGTENGHNYVDLGLPSGLKWATCNVGASSPEEYGDYYAWGETITKSLSDNCSTLGLTESELKSQGYIDEVGNLTSQHDAATANWGGAWRMPTNAEQQELLDNCTWTWTTENDVKGYKVIGTNGNSIFLPVAGLHYGSSLSSAGNDGYYWSSTRYDYKDNFNYYAYYLSFNSDFHYMSFSCRNYGQSVRPVFGGNFTGPEEQPEDEPEQPEIVLPTVTTNSVTNITTNTATCGGNVTSDGNGTVTARGICWSETSEPKINNLYSEESNEGTGTGNFTLSMTNLKANTTYYVRAYATNEAGTVYGEVKSFKTLEEEPEIVLPTVTTNSVTNITENSATCGGNVTSDGNATVTARGICWSTSQNPTIEDNKTNNGSGTGSFTSYMSGLKDGITYYVRAYATNEKGTEYGEEKSFTTVEIFLPIVTTNSITDITTNSATCGGNVTSDGNATVTARGICWSTSPNPTIEDNKTNNGSGTGSYSSNLSNLSDNTTYYVRAYATNEKGTSYGEEKSFTTYELLLPTVTTNAVTNIKPTTATCGGNVTSDGNATVTARGICWSTSQNPTIEDNKINNGSGTGSFTSYMSGLKDGTTYYVRAYATNEKGTSYGEEVSFTTLERTFENGYEYVDLGLSVKWATCNVGADSPEEYGDYFAWGETSTKKTYDEDNCPTYGLSISKLQSQGYIDSEGNLTSQYDAATANWGGDWRMPTYDELKELSNNCTWTWTTQNGVNGYNVEGHNGNSIFLPAAGFRNGSSLRYAGSDGHYWSSTSYDNHYYCFAYYLVFYSSDQNMKGYFRNFGRSVRPVLE